MVTMLICGDFAPVRRCEQLVLQGGPVIFGDLREAISGADISLVNLEAPLFGGSLRLAKSGPNLRAHPECVSSLAAAGFDIVGLANNHIMDFGLPGLKSTREACEAAGLLTCGTGRNPEDATVFVNKAGVNVAVVAVAEREFNRTEDGADGAIILDSIDTAKQVREAAELSDAVVVTIHGGNEYYELPRPGLQKVCRYLVECGASAIVCHHSHVIGGYEIYRGSPIVYGIGNFLFDHPSPPRGWNMGCAVRLTLAAGSEPKADVSFELLPFEQSVAIGGLRCLQGAAKSDILAHVEGLRKIIEDPIALQERWGQLADERAFQYLAPQFIPFRFPGMRRLNSWLHFDRLLISRSRALEVQNVARCDSHRELLVEVLRRR